MCDILISPALCPPQVYPNIVAVGSFRSFIYFCALVHQIVVLTTARLNNKLPKYIVAQTIACLLGATGPMLMQNDLIAPTTFVKMTRYIFGLAPISISILCVWYRLFRPTTVRSIAVVYAISIMMAAMLIVTSVPELWKLTYLVPWAVLNMFFLIFTTPMILYVLISYRHAKRWWHAFGVVLWSVAQFMALGMIILNRDAIVSDFKWWFIQIDLYHLVSVITMTYMAQRRRNFSNTTDSLVI